ncbi:FMN-binding protein [Streptomyces fuscichromogenes]|uniref:FMN-binding protein n=1 Tax=Streptomyces fuscichromogenes TaxID=1324013 RepID=A0A917XEN3_9ACTN|nr:FMN-binding protein [Streptomyces fuscichromogenes]GGN17441.1 FMN-binding protein [Streptomyces fuscichromogenes]
MHALNKNRPLRRIMLASAATVSGMVMLLALKPHTAPTVVTGSAAPVPSASASASPGAGSGSGSTTGSSGKSGSSSTGTRTVTGDTVQTRWGPVQVKVTIKNGKITDVTAVQYPSENPRDQQINSYAIPQLRSEALAAQSASIDTVSGATYTSEGYQQSLQSALDSAGL